MVHRDLGVGNGILKFGNGTLRLIDREWYIEIWRLGMVH